MLRYIIILLVFSLVTACSERPATNDQSYPWQIKKTKMGNTQIFGIELGVMSLEQVSRIIKKKYKLGLFENKKGRLVLEAYLGEFTRSGVSGKLIVVLQADKDKLVNFKLRSIKQERQNSGDIKYILSANDRVQAEKLIVTVLSYIPYVQLDKELIEKRFGIPDRVITSKDKLKHYIYKNKGLDIIQNDDGKELLQYVSPNNIESLLAPLRESSFSN